VYRRAEANVQHHKIVREAHLDEFVCIDKIVVSQSDKVNEWEHLHQKTL
jgi:hypothetical protein